MQEVPVCDTLTAATYLKHWQARSFDYVLMRFLGDGRGQIAERFSEYLLDTLLHTHQFAGP
jgi:hypothetical protein